MWNQTTYLAEVVPDLQSSIFSTAMSPDFAFYQHLLLSGDSGSKPPHPQPPGDKCAIKYNDESCTYLNLTQHFTCLTDVAKLYQIDSDHCACNLIDEEFAFAQSFELTINLVVILFILGKLCAIHFDSPIENKLVFRLHLTFLLWNLCHMTVISMQFFVNPETLYNNYILTSSP